MQTPAKITMLQFEGITHQGWLIVFCMFEKEQYYNTNNKNHYIANSKSIMDFEFFINRQI